MEREHHATNIGKIIDRNQCTLKERLPRATAYVLIFISKLEKPTVRKLSQVTASELIEAKEVWIKDLQNNIFPNRI